MTTQQKQSVSDYNNVNTECICCAVGIILGCVAGAGIILVAVFTLLFIALRYVQLSGMASMRKDDPTLLDKQQARLSGFFA